MNMYHDFKELLLQSLSTRDTRMEFSLYLRLIQAVNCILHAIVYKRPQWICYVWLSSHCDDTMFSFYFKLYRPAHQSFSEIVIQIQTKRGQS